MNYDFIDEVLDEEEAEVLAEELADSFRSFVDENCLKKSTWMFNKKRCDEVSEVLANLIAELKENGDYISHKPSMCDKFFQDELFIGIKAKNFEPEYKFVKYIIDNVDGFGISSCNIPELIYITISFKNVRFRVA